MKKFFAHVTWILMCMAISVSAFGDPNAAKIAKIKEGRAMIQKFKPHQGDFVTGSKEFQQYGKALAIRHLNSMLFKLNDPDTVQKANRRAFRLDVTPLTENEKADMNGFLAFSTGEAQKYLEAVNVR